MTRITVKEAADRLSVTEEQIHSLMQGGLNIGFVIRGKRRNTYIVYKELIERLEAAR